MKSTAVPNNLSVSLYGMLIMAMCSLGYFAVPFLAPFFIADVGMTTQSYGFIYGLLPLFAAACILPVSAASDALRPQVAVFFAFCVSALGFAILALASNEAGLIVAMLAFGLALSFGNPLANSYLRRSSQYWTSGLVVGFKQSGGQASSILSSAVLLPIAVSFGWRHAAFAASAFVVLCSIILSWQRRLKEVERVASRAVSQPSGGRFSLPTLNLGVPKPLLMYIFWAAAGLGTVVAFIPLYGLLVLVLSPQEVGSTMVLAAIVAALARIGSGLVPASSAYVFLFSMSSLALASSIFLASVATIATTSYTYLFFSMSAVIILSASSVWKTVVTRVLLSSGDSSVIGKLTGLTQLVFFLGAGFGTAVIPSLARGNYTHIWIQVCACFALSSLAVGRVGARRATFAGL